MTRKNKKNFRFSGDINLDMMFTAKWYNTSIIRWIRKGIDPSQTLLDFGAGKGTFCNELWMYNVEAIELDSQFHQYLHCPFYTRLEHTVKKYDVIYTINVLEHIENDREIVSVFLEKLNKNGRVKAFVPASKVLYSEMDRFVGHVRRYEKDMLIDLFESNGFRIVYCRYFDFLGFFISWFYKAIRGPGTPRRAYVLLFDWIIFPVSRFIDIITRGKIIGKNLVLEAVKP